MRRSSQILINLLGLCWVIFRSCNFVDAKRKELVCITLGFFLNSASGNGIWTLGSGIWKKNGLGNGTGTPPFRTLLFVILGQVLMNLRISTSQQENRAVLKIVTPSNINLGGERKKSQTCINYVIRTLTVGNW